MKKFLWLTTLGLISCFYCAHAMEDKNSNSPKSIDLYERAIKKLDEYKDKIFENDASPQLQQTFLSLLEKILKQMPVTSDDAVKKKTYLHIVNLCITTPNLINTYEGYLKIMLEFVSNNLKRLKETGNIEEKK
jgi:hypothetical protein